ncbi:MAG: WYL domain-containing transcriptional regulator [Prevotella sp.]|nr:WYL domain-containing transcriptional regulator [Prevotella sp.]
MRMNKYGKELDLLLLLTENHSYTAQELADRLGVTRRNLYYYLEYLRDSGFVLIKSGYRYRLDRSSPFFRRLHDNIALTRDEAIHLHRLLDSAEQHDYQALTIKAKLERQFHLEELSDPAVMRRMNRNIRQLKKAIAEKRMVTLKAYSSPHSQTVGDRIVEPFLLMNGGTDIRCHELRTHENKTYKVSRAAEIEVMDVPWICEDRHREVYTDIFGFSGEERFRVSLRLGLLSHNLLLEEHPAAEPFVTPIDDSHWQADIDVVSYRGIGRFVLGLYDDITVRGDKGFKAYVADKIKQRKARN